MAMLSIVGLYNYDNKILDGIKPYLPTAPTDPVISVFSDPVDFDILHAAIMMRCAELSLVYTDPDVLKFQITMWAAKNRLTWQKLYDTLYLRYDPLFSRIRSYTLDRATTDSRVETDSTAQNDITSSEKTNNDETNRTVKDKTIGYTKTDVSENSSDETAEKKNGTNIHAVSGFNDVNNAIWNNKDRDTSDASSDVKETGKRTGETEENEKRDRDFTEKTIAELNEQINGNLRRSIDDHINRNDNGTLHDVIAETIRGQRPFQELILLEREIVTFNLYDHIADDFVKNFCVMIY